LDFYFYLEIKKLMALIHIPYYVFINFLIDIDENDNRQKSISLNDTNYEKSKQMQTLCLYEM